MPTSADPHRPPSRGSHERHTLELRGKVARFAVVADTHGRPHPECSRLIAAQEPDAILHAGDIGDLAVLDLLTELAPVFAVRGNIDGTGKGVPDALTLDVVDPGSENRVARRLLRLLMVHIGVNGPRLRRDAAELARSEGAGLVVCGHSHVPFIGRDRGLAIFNPGSIGPRRFQLPIVFGVLEIDRERARMHHVDCETGELWKP